MRTLILFATVLLSCLSVTAQSIMQVGKVATPWELEKQEGTIEGYTRQVEGQALKEFKVVCNMDRPMDSIRAILMNPQTWHHWYSHAFYDWQILDTLPDGYMLYCAGHTPALVAERDFVLEINGAMAGEKYLMKIKAQPQAYPVQPKRLRVDQMEMLWILSPISADKTEAVFMGFSSPGGSLPEGFANTIMIQMPMETVAGLCKYAHRNLSRQ